MPHSDEIQNSLERQFKKVDTMHASDDLQVFGRDTTRIFKEIDNIRTKQIELATEHIGLEAIDEMMLPADKQNQHEHNLIFFDKKEMTLKSLMSKLDDLGQIMNEFRGALDLNPHKTLDKHEVTASTPNSSKATSRNNSRRSSNEASISASNALNNENYKSEESSKSTSSNTRFKIPMITIDQSTPTLRK